MWMPVSLLQIYIFEFLSVLSDVAFSGHCKQTQQWQMDKKTEESHHGLNAQKNR